MTDEEASVRRICHAGLIPLLEGCEPEAIEVFLKSEAATPYNGDPDAFLTVLVALVEPLVLAKSARQKAETASLRRETDEGEKDLAERLRRIALLRAAITSGTIH